MFFTSFFCIFAALNFQISIMKALVIAILMAVPWGLQAQEGRPWEDYLNEVMTAEDAESESWERTYELLCELEQHPLNLNTVSREQLEELPFLSALQIEELMEYRYRYGTMKSLGELRMIRSLGEAPRKLLTYFIYIDETEPQRKNTLGDVFRYGHHELIATMRVPFNQRKGDEEGYLGDPYRHWFRYQFAFDDQVKLGLVGSKDAGEPFFNHQNRYGYDYYSPYLQIKNMGRLETLVLGNYRVSMGMGLVMNNGFSLGKVSMLQNLGRAANTIRAHSSRSDGYLQGAAATLNLGRGLKLTAFASYRGMDATVNKDSTVSSVLDDGYHRTTTEMAKKHNLQMLKTGGSLRLQHRGLYLGMNALYVHLNRELKPNTRVLYRRHYPKGTDFLNLSLDYGYASHRLSLNGETALDRDGHLATIHSLSWRVCDELSLIALQRFYSYSYTSLDAQSYSDGGRVQNESGIYLGLSWHPSPTWRADYYADFAYFAWARYQVSQSSHSWDHLLQVSHTSRQWTLGGRYRLRMKQKDSDDKKTLINHWEHRGRLSAEFAHESGFGCRTQLDGGYTAYGNGEWGAMLSESLSYTHRWLRLNAGAGYFHTDSYDSRAWLYENGPLYTYSMGQFYGEGIRYWVMAKAQIGQRLMFTAKIGVTDYFDRNHIGSSYQQIDGSSQTDLDLQLRWKI